MNATEPQAKDPSGDVPALAERFVKAGALRIRCAGLDAALEPFTHPELLAAGKVNVLDLQDIAGRLGERWEGRRADVHAYAEATLVRLLEGRGYHLRLTDTDILVCHPDLDRFTGHAHSIRYLREIFTHFLGEATQAEVSVHTVLRIGGGEVQAAAATAAPPPAQTEPAAFARRASLTGLADDPDPGARVDTTAGCPVRVSCVLEPVTELKNFTRIGFRMARRLVAADTGSELTPEARARLSPADLLECDLATIARGLQRLESGRPAPQEPSLIIPISAGSLGSSVGRTEIVMALEQASAHVKRGVICELCDLEGLPAGTILERVTLIRPAVFLVIGHVRSGAAAEVAALVGSGLQGVSIDCPPTSGDAQFNLWAKAAVASAKQVAKPVLLYRVPSIRQASLSVVLGATHITLAP